MRQRLSGARDRYLDAIRDEDELQRERAALEETAVEMAADGRDDDGHIAHRQQLEARQARLAEQKEAADRDVELAEKEAEATLSQEEVAREWERYLGRLRTLLDSGAGARRV